MQIWLEFFCIVAAVALVVQVVILTMLFFQLRKTTENVNRLVGDLHSRVGPILTRAQILLDDTQPKISSMVNDASHIVYLARGQAQKIEPHFNSLHQRRRFLHRPPETVAELRARVLHSFERPRQDAIRVHQLPAKAVRGVRKHAVDFLRLPARQIHDV